MEIQASQDNICALFVTTQVDLDFPRRVARIIDQVSAVVITDNHSDESVRQMLLKLAENAKVHVIFNDKNLGLAASMNKGYQWTMDHNYPWVLTFDEDSRAAPDMVQTYCRLLEEVHHPEKIGIFGCNHIDSNSGEYYVNPGEFRSREWKLMRTVITSGSLCSMKMHKEIGFLRGYFFIDGVDHEICLRARYRDYRVLITKKPLLEHPMGYRNVITIPFLPFLKIVTTNYSPFRWYCIVRNRLILISEYLFKDTAWVVTRCFLLFGWIGLTLIFEEKRWIKFKMILLGIWDWISQNKERDIALLTKIGSD